MKYRTSFAAPSDFGMFGQTALQEKREQASQSIERMWANAIRRRMSPFIMKAIGLAETRARILQLATPSAQKFQAKHSSKNTGKVGSGAQSCSRTN